MVTILIVACPCALGLAVPLVVVVSNGLCAERGIFIKNSEVLEQGKSIKTIVFDKTGTLTEGVFEVQKVKAIDMSEEELINIQLFFLSRGRIIKYSSEFRISFLSSNTYSF